MILEQHQGGMLDCLGQMWTWVSGTAEDDSARFGWLEYSVGGRLHYRTEGRLHYEVEGRLHYTPGSEDI